MPFATALAAGPLQAPPRTALSDVAALGLTETGGRRRGLVLRGPALPHADGTTIPGETILQTKDYGHETLQRVVGFRRDAISYSGEWVDAALTQAEVKPVWHEDGAERALRFGAELEWAVEELRLGGELLHLSSPQGDELLGHIARTRFGRGLRGVRTWEFEFAPAKSLRVPPDERLALVSTPTDAARSLLDAVGQAIDPLQLARTWIGRGATLLQDVLDGFRSGPLAAVEAGADLFHQALSVLENGIVGLVLLGRDFTEAGLEYARAWRRVADLGETARGAAVQVGLALDREVPASIARSSEPEAQWEAAEELNAALDLARRCAAESAAIRRDARRALAQTPADAPPAVHRLAADEDLRDVAQRYYGDPDLWTVIADENGLSGYNARVGTRLLIPQRGSTR